MKSPKVVFLITLITRDPSRTGTFGPFSAALLRRLTLREGQR